MRVYSRRFQGLNGQLSFPFFGQTPSPEGANLLAAVLPGAKTPKDAEELALARGRFLFRKPDVLTDIAILGSTGSDPSKHDLQTLVSYVWGSKAGAAEILPSSSLIGSDWRIVDPANDKKVIDLNGIQKMPTRYPVTAEQLGETLNIIGRWIKEAQNRFDEGDPKAARTYVNNVHFNISMAYFRLKMARDSGAIGSDTIHAVQELLAGAADEAGKLAGAIAARSTLVGRIFQSIIGFFARGVSKVRAAFSDDFKLVQKKVAELYAARDASDKLLRTLLELPQTKNIQRAEATIAMDLAALRRGISTLEMKVAAEGLRMQDIFPVGSPMTGLGNPMMVTLPVIGAVKVSTIIWVVINILISILIGILIEKWMEPAIVLEAEQKMEEAGRKIKVAEALKHDAMMEVLKADFESLLAQGIKVKDAWYLALERARKMDELMNPEDFEKLAEGRMLPILKAALTREAEKRAQARKKGQLYGALILGGLAFIPILAYFLGQKYNPGEIRP